MSSSAAFIPPQIAKEHFLNRVDQLIDWAIIAKRLNRHDVVLVDASRSAPDQLILFKMLLCGLWFGNLSDADTEKLVAETPPIWPFLQLDCPENIPSATLLADFRSRLYQHHIWDDLLEEVCTQLATQGVVSELSKNQYPHSAPNMGQKNNQHKATTFKRLFNQWTVNNQFPPPKKRHKELYQHNDNSNGKRTINSKAIYRHTRKNFPTAHKSIHRILRAWRCTPLSFFREFIGSWEETGAIAPSSSALAYCIVENAGVARANRVLELGPGTGSFTAIIRDALGEQGQYLGLELNHKFVRKLRQRFPDLHFESSAAQEFEFKNHLDSDEQFDVIVCGLPWTAFPEKLQIAILDNVMPVLKPGGMLATFAYKGFHLLPAGRHFRQLLKNHCSQLETTRLVWKNIPPAFVYLAIK